MEFKFAKGVGGQIAKMFARPTAQGVVGDGTVPGATVGLFEEQAVQMLIKYLTRLPDLDEVLRQAGIRREKLRILLYDDEIAQACETRCDALLATPMRLEPSEGEQADSIRDIMAPVLTEAMTGVFQARLFGYSVLEAVYFVREDKKVGLRFLGEKPMEWFQPMPDGRLMFYPDDGSGGSTGLEVDQRYKFFLTRSRPTYRQPFGETLLSRLYWPWFFRQNGWKFWSKFLERFGSPLLVGKSADPTAMVNALLMAQSQAVLGVGPTDEVEAVGTASGNNGQAFEAFESAVIRRIQKVVLGQTLTSGTDGGSGNRALGQVHDSVRTDKRNSDLVMAAATMQRVIDAICELNGFKKHVVTFADDTGLEADRATRDKDLHAVGVRFKEEYIAACYDIEPGVEFEMTDETPIDPATGLPMKPVAPGGPTGSTKQPTGSPGDKAKLKVVKAGRFSKDTRTRRFTQQQEMVEDVADDLEDEDLQPLDRNKVRQAVLAATSPQDLEDRLFALLGEDLGEDDFSSILEQALFTADVLGYVHATGKV